MNRQDRRYPWSQPWIYSGITADGCGAGGGTREHRRTFHKLPLHGVKLKFVLRDAHGRRRIKTDDDRYFTLGRTTVP